MMRGHERTRRRDQAPRLPEREGGPHLGDEAAWRARLAAVMKALWAGLQRLGRLVRSFLARRQLFVDVPTVEEEEKVPLPHQVRQRRSGLSELYGDKAEPRRKREPRQPPPAPPSPVLMVKGKSVSRDLESQYKEYCRLRSCLPIGSSICHMCFFEMQRHEHMTVRNREMIKHCSDKHLTRGQKCKVAKCAVRVSTERDLELHMHFCHPSFPF